MNVPLSDIGRLKVSACLPLGTKAQLDALQPFFASERKRAQQLGMTGTTGFTALELAARVYQWREKKAAMHRQGLLVDSKRALVTGGLVQVITERGWDRHWPDIPAHRRGRWPGVPTSGPWPESHSIEVPADLVRIVAVACWHTSAEAIELLYKWRERYPEAIPSKPSRSACSAEAIEECQRLSAKITTKGDIWRAAYAAGIRNALERQRAQELSKR